MKGAMDYVVDTRALEGQRERSRAWSQWVPNAFPGLSVKRLSGSQTTGLVKMIQIGPMRVFSIIQSRQTLANRPDTVNSVDKTTGMIYQKQGRGAFRFGRESTQLREGDLIVVDGGREFEIESIGTTHTYVVTLPRHYAFERAPKLFSSGWRKLSKSAALLPYLVAQLELALADTRELVGRQRAGFVEAFLTLLEAMPSEKAADSQSLDWRIKRALELIETAPADPELDAQTIADDLGISRRRLDQVFLEALDTTVSFQIAERRLTFAASSLCDPARAKNSVTNIAFLSGFHDGAHFSRAFKKRFGVAPREFRKQAMAE